MVRYVRNIILQDRGKKMFRKKMHTGGSGIPLWEIEAKRRLAIWRQQVMVTTQCYITYHFQY